MIVNELFVSNCTFVMLMTSVSIIVDTAVNTVTLVVPMYGFFVASGAGGNSVRIGMGTSETDGEADGDGEMDLEGLGLDEGEAEGFIE